MLLKGFRAPQSTTETPTRYDTCSRVYNLPGIFCCTTDYSRKWSTSTAHDSEVITDVALETLVDWVEVIGATLFASCSTTVSLPTIFPTVW